MADSDFSVYARIQADTSNFEKGMKNAQTSASNLSKSFGNLSKVITKALSFVGVVFSAKAIADFGKTSVQSATQATKQFKILDNTVKATGADAWTSTKQLEGLAKELSNQTNYSVTELEEMESVLLGFRNITDDTFSEASEAILDMATVMGMDLKSATQTVGKALDDPIKGLDSLRRQGFQFTDEQKEELAQLVKTGEQIKAQKIILDELAQSYGGAAKAGQDSFAKQRHAMENLKDELGGKLIPVLQVFAEENAKVLDALRKKIEQMDFSKAVNVVTNLKNIFAKRFEEIKQRVVVAKDSIVDFLKRFNFGPVVSILDTLIGHLVETVKMFREMQGLNLGSLKEGLIELSNSEAFEKFAIFFNTIVDVSHGILEEVKKTWPEIRDVIINVTINIWDKIKELFEKLDDALNGSGNTLHLWADLFWKELDDIYRITQDLLKGVTHLLKGDWATAWEYAKLAVLRVADGVLDAISTIANGMPKIINKIINEWNRVLGWINKGLEKLNKDPIDLVPEFKSVDLSDVTGVTDKIEEVEKKIQELTGAAADNGISHLDKLSGRWKGFTSNALGNIEALTEGAEEAGEKTGETAGKVENVVKTTFAEVSEWDSKLLSQRLEGLKEYDAEYLAITKQIINAEKEKALVATENDEEKQKIELYYLNELAQAEEDYHKAVAEKYADDLKTVEDTKQKMIEESKEMRDKTISAFKEIGTASGKVFSYVGQSFVGVSKVIATTAKTVVKSSVEIFTSFKNTVVKSFTSIKSVVKESWESFKKITSFSIDDSLNSILEFEDSILTFFIETVPKLPDYLSSVFESVTVTIGSIIDSINFENLTTNINGIISSLADNLPVVVDKVLSTVQSLITTIINVVTENAPQIFALFDSVFEKMGTYFMDFIPDVINKLGRVVPVLITWIAEKASAVMNFLGDFMENLAEKINIEEILNNLITSIRNGVERVSESISTNLPRITKVIVEFLETAMEKLPALIDDILPKLLDILDSIFVSVGEVITAFVPKAIKILGEMLPTLITWVAGWIGNFINFLGNILEEISEKIDIEELIHNLAEAITKGLTSIGASIETSLPKMLSFLGTIVESIANELPAILKTALPIIISTISQMINFIAAELPKILDILLPAITEILDKNLPGLIESIVNLVVTIAGKLPDIIMDIFPTLLTGVVKLVETLVQKLPELLTSILDKLPELLQTIIKAVLDNLPVLVTAILTALPDIITSLLKGVFNLLHDLIFETDWGGVWEGIVNSFKAIWEGLGTFFETIWDDIKKPFEDFGKWFEDLWDGISDWFDNLWDGIVNSLKEVWSGIGNFFSTIFDNLKKKVFEPFGTWFKTMWTNLKSWFKNLWDGFLDVMKAPINAIIKAINVVINGLNKVSFSIPDWVPFVGGKKFGISIPNLQELAVGTENARKGLTLVGEAGPELVNFRGGEQVLNNHNTNKALENMGGTTINQNVTFNNLADTTAFAMLQQLKQYNRQMAINGIV